MTTVNKRRAAFFDLDRTLIPHKSSEFMFVRYLVSINVINAADILRAFFFGLAGITGGWGQAVVRNKYYFRGKKSDEIENYAKKYFHDKIDSLVSGEAIKKINEHRAAGDLLLMISGAPYFIVNEISAHLGFDNFKGTDLEREGNVFTGKIGGVHPYGPSKAKILEYFKEKYSIDLSLSSAYADHFSDRFMLEMTGNPNAVNPDRKLREYALKHKWKIINF